MLSFLLGLILSKIATIGAPLLLLAAAVFLLFRGWVQAAIAVALVAGGWFLCGVLYQEGNAACQRRIDREVERIVSERTGLLIKRLKAAAAQDAATQKEMSELEDTIRTIRQAREPSVDCKATAEEEKAYAPLIPAR